MSFYVYESANLFCGDHDPTNSKHLSLATLKLPNMEEATSDFMSAGSIMGVNWGMGVLNPLEVTFKLNGYDPAMMSLFGIGKRAKQTYTAYGVIRDKMSGRAIEAKSVFFARLGTAEQDEISRGEMGGTDYTLIELTHYETYFDGREKHYLDFFTQQWRVDGASQNSDERRILRIPGV